MLDACFPALNLSNVTNKYTDIMVVLNNNDVYGIRLQYNYAKADAMLR